ncbi:MAG: toxin RelE [Gammaproteobacteria bacterium]|nr:MAG: toxin RelE [Gammaproteobacteria bacterium]
MKVEFIETSVFTRRIAELMPDDRYRELQLALLLNPEAGAVIPGTAGLRKVRWALPGQGKRGGVRVIYYWYTQGDHIYMLFVYAKNEQNNLTAPQKAMLKKLVEKWLKDED